MPTVRTSFQVLSDTSEFDELPVRHNEDLMNEELAASCSLKAIGAMDSPHLKCHLLLQVHSCDFVACGRLSSHRRTCRVCGYLLPTTRLTPSPCWTSAFAFFRCMVLECDFKKGCDVNCRR